MNPAPESIAIVGMAGRFPRAATLLEFWRNLRGGVEAVSFFGDEQVQWLPLEHRPRPGDPRFVKARAILEKAEWFDAEFFQVNPREADIMDPQHRVFLECCWEALEDAACDPTRFDGLIGVFAGASMNTYLLTNLLTNRGLVEDFGLFPTMIVNDGDFVPTRVSYKLNLRGPSINVQTACSTSLVAVCLAAQNLLSYRCDVALAGGVSITFPSHRGQHHVEGGIMSRDGHCRAFDARASGTVLGDGAGVVVLKRLGDALAAGDRIRAVIKGTAINNDGAVKIGYTAPSVDGQAEAIAMALADAGVAPESISYVEAHGTGTPLGDPIEIAGLKKAFGAAPGAAPRCAVGSVKSNIGHLDIAAGVAGLIKTVLALEHGELPPSLHFEQANPQCELAGSPFFINAALRPWPRGEAPRRAGVSSFGIGGTNAHVVLEEAPTVETTVDARPHHLLLLSARTAAGLEQATDNLAAHLAAHPGANLADVAFTLQVGRKQFRHRRAVVCGDVAQAVTALQTRDAQRTFSLDCDSGARPVAFLFPGQGAQAVNMARELHEAEPEFREQVDEGCRLLEPHLGTDLRRILFPPPEQAAEAARALNETRLTQPALFVIEHALAQLWMSWGVRPAAMIGHSIGEYVAACLAGVFTLEDALAVVAVRARLMQAQAPGAMIAARVPEHRMVDLLNENLALAAVNAPGLCVVSGPFDAIGALEKRLAASAIPSRRLATSHAFHSPMMEPAVRPFAEHLRGVRMSPPRLPWVSNLTGKWIRPEEATSADYWASHLRRAVRFADGVTELLAGDARVLLEVGPGHTLAGLARQHPAFSAVGAAAVSTLGAAREGFPARAAMLHACGQLWAAGAGIDWRNGLHRGQRRAVVTLPTYPFERRRHWIEPGVEWLAGAAEAKPAMPVNAKEPVVAVVATEPATPEGKGTLDAVRELLRELSGVDIRTAGEGITFYQLGFDSLFLSQVSRQIAERFGTEVSFRQLREEISTPRQLADHLDRAMSRQVPRAAAAETPAAATHERRLPLTDAQREIWFASQLGAAMSSAYAESTILRLRGGLDRAALARAAQALVDRHEALRMTISAAGDEVIVAPTAVADVQWREFSAGDEAAARRYLADEVHAPFDLIRGPLFRVRVAQLAVREHLVAVAAHHIVCDGWSLGVLVRELAKLHSASGSSAGALPPAPSFVEHAAREQAVRATETFAAAERFWTGQFADGVPAFDVPTDRPRPAERSHAGGFVVHTLPAEVTAAVKQLCAAKSCTPFTALFAAFAVLMHRLSGQDDIVVGVPSSAQAMDGVESLVGHFANLLPLRSRWRDDQPFAEFLGETSRRLNAALEHWRYPFGALLQKLNLARDGGRVPLAPIVFNTTRRRDPLHFAGLEAEVTDNPKRFVNFDLNFNFALADDALSLGCYFSTELFDEATILRWFGHLETLLRDIARDAGTAVGDLALLSAAERRQMLVEWNDTALDYPRDACIAELFEAQARQTPDAVAIVHGHERVTYRELDAAADAVATRLRTAGVGPDTLVGLLLGRTPRLLAAIFGVLKAGGAYVPLDPQYPAERLAFIAGDTRMPVLVTERGLVDRQPAGNYTTLLIDELEGDAGPTPENPAAAIRPSADSLAYVIHTSGSTGEPKGVAIVQRCVVALVAWARQLYRSEELDGVLFATSASFDISVFEIFCPLCLGGKIVLAENILELASLPAAGEVRFLSGTPSAVAEVVRLDLLPRSLTTVALAGEAFPQPLVDALYRRPHIERVYELYGPTETTVYSTGSLRKPHTRPTLGRPFPNERIYIVDRRLQPVPIGVTGEICIGGDKLARGYLHRPELTASRFITAPFANGERVYRSGDLGRWLADGTIESTGRADHQVKVRGHRVELGEIELAFARHLAVRECVVIARPDSGGNNRLLAYVVPVPGARIDGATLREHLRKKLPAHAVPSAVVLLERMPLTENRKLDRAALPEPDFAAAAGEFVAPRTETEEIVAGIWRDVLAVARVGMNDNFFELGGHSLLATQVIARVNDVLGVELDLAQFFAAPTIAGLAGVIEQLLVAQIKAAPPSETMAGEDLALAK